MSREVTVSPGECSFADGEGLKLLVQWLWHKCDMFSPFSSWFAESTRKPAGCLEIVSCFYLQYLYFLRGHPPKMNTRPIILVLVCGFQKKKKVSTDILAMIQLALSTLKRGRAARSLVSLWYNFLVLIGLQQKEDAFTVSPPFSFFHQSFEISNTNT